MRLLTVGRPLVGAGAALSRCACRGAPVDEHWPLPSNGYTTAGSGIRDWTNSVFQSSTKCWSESMFRAPSKTVRKAAMNSSPGDQCSSKHDKNKLARLSSSSLLRLAKKLRMVRGNVEASPHCANALAQRQMEFTSCL